LKAVAKPAPGAGRQQHAGVGPAEPADARGENGDSGANLYGRPFATQRQPGADRQESAKEFHRHQSNRSRWNLPAQDSFDMRNAAARSVWREPPHHPRGNQRRDSTRSDNNQESPDGMPMAPGDHRVTQAIAVREQEPENRPDTSSGRSDDEGHRRGAHEATFVLSMVVYLVHDWLKSCLFIRWRSE
jgi:hypothetical protein